MCRSEEKVVSDVAEEENKKSKMGLIIGLIVVGLLLASGVSYFVATKIMGDKTATVAKHEPGVLMKVGDPKEGMIVNVGGVNSGRYLKVAVVLEVAPSKNPPKDAKAINPDEIIVQDTVIQFFRAQKVEQFAPEKQDELKDNIRKAVNAALGSDRVYSVYFTNFVLQ